MLRSGVKKMADTAYLIKGNKTLVEGVTKEEYSENYIKIANGTVEPSMTGGFKENDLYVVYE